MSFRVRTRRLLRVAAGIAVLALALTACGSTSNGAGTTQTGACGTVPTRLPADPDGVFAKLPAALQAGYNGYSTPVHASPWTDWKPPAGGAVIGISWTAPVNDYAADTLNSIKAALSSFPGVKNVIVLAGANQGDVTAQLQQFQSLVQQRVNLIIAASGTGGPFVSAVDGAAKQGIPTVSAFNTIPTKNAVNIVPNNYLAAAQTAAAAIKAAGDSTTVLKVHGIQGISIDGDAFRGFDDVLQNCPKVKVAGEVTGDFVPAQAKSQVLRFLSTHPGKLGVVLQSGGMSTGIIGAFTSTGRPVPTVNDVAALKGSLGYWRANKKTYTGTASGGGAEAYAQLLSGVVQGMVAGNGVLISEFVQTQPLIDQNNIDTWAQPDWDLQTAGTAPDPAGTFDNGPILTAGFQKKAS